MVEGSHLFFAKKDRILHDEQHLAEMVSLWGRLLQNFSYEVTSVSSAGITKVCCSHRCLWLTFFYKQLEGRYTHTRAITLNEIWAI
jgi:hypothetical protein